MVRFINGVNQSLSGGTFYHNDNPLEIRQIEELINPPPPAEKRYIIQHPLVRENENIPRNINDNDTIFIKDPLGNYMKIVKIGGRFHDQLSQQERNQIIGILLQNGYQNIHVQIQVPQEIDPAEAVRQMNAMVNAAGNRRN